MNQAAWMPVSNPNAACAVLGAVVVHVVVVTIKCIIYYRDSHSMPAGQRKATGSQHRAKAFGILAHRQLILQKALYQ